MSELTYFPVKIIRSFFINIKEADKVFSVYLFLNIQRVAGGSLEGYRFISYSLCQNNVASKEINCVHYKATQPEALFVAVDPIYNCYLLSWQDCRDDIVLSFYVTLQSFIDLSF